MNKTATSQHRSAARHQIAEAPPARDVRGIEADRKRLRGKFLSPFPFKARKQPTFIDDGD